MDKCKDFIYRNQSKIKIILLISATLSTITCFSKFDYNLVLFLYLYFLWDNNIDNKELESSERLNVFFFLLFSFLIDLAWLFIWPGRWSSYTDYEKNVHFIVTLSSWIILGLKLFITFSIGLIKWSSIRSSLPKAIQEKLSGEGYSEQVDDK